MTTISPERIPVKHPTYQPGDPYPHWCWYHHAFEERYPDRSLPLLPPAQRGGPQWGLLPPERHYTSHGGHQLDCCCERCFVDVIPNLGLHLAEIEAEVEEKARGMVPELFVRLLDQEQAIAALKEQVRQMRNYLSSFQPAAPPRKQLPKKKTEPQSHIDL